MGCYIYSLTIIKISIHDNNTGIILLSVSSQIINFLKNYFDFSKN